MPDSPSPASRSISVEEAREKLHTLMLELFYRWAANEALDEPTDAQKHDEAMRENAYHAQLEILIAAVRSESHPSASKEFITLKDALTEVCREMVGSTVAMFPEIPARKIAFILEGYRDALVMAFAEDHPSASRDTWHATAEELIQETRDSERISGEDRQKRIGSASRDKEKEP